MTREDRIAKVKAAAKGLPVALKVALADPDNEAAWEDVEALGAVVHRQSRILAGKSRGG